MNENSGPGMEFTQADRAGFLELPQQLMSEPSVVGTEDSFFRVLRREFEEFDVKVERHPGSLVARGKEPEVLVLPAHIDRHGLLCTEAKRIGWQNLNIFLSTSSPLSTTLSLLFPQIASPIESHSQPFSIRSAQRFPLDEARGAL